MNYDLDHLKKIDQETVLHPLHHPAFHENPLIFERGDGVWLYTVEGRKLMDGFAGLWNVNIGHGHKAMAAAAASQIETLAYCSGYAGSASIPMIKLAEKLSAFAYPNLKTTFFASGGAEANESAFKTVRHYHKRMGKADKTKIIARTHAYHGITLAAMSATGMSVYWPMFEPRVPGFSHIPAPYSYRFTGDMKVGETLGQAAARALEEAILREGPDTVGGFIAEPVQGTGGVIVPPDDYFPLIRQICDKYDVLLIADEVITGFGRTGRWFGLQRYGIQPDIMSFAKGVTSGYLPLGGIQISDKIKEVIVNSPLPERWMHAYTYSGHPTCCAVALTNIGILESEGMVANAGRMGQRLLDGFKALEAEFGCIGDVRGLGLMAALEFTSDRATQATSGGLGVKVQKAALERGLFTRALGDNFMVSPPLGISEQELDWMLQVIGESIAAVTK